MPRRKAALFVDFDNIYLSLQKANPRAGERFARQPDRWLRWLESGGHEKAVGDETTAPRSVLLRRCYLTPGRFGEFRPFFTRAGFIVVDCPPFTRMAKNSADIVMVMDVLDALDHRTRFEEFLVFSGDSDFTPVLLRLRMHDRRTVVLTDALTAAAYRAASDIAIRQDTFVEEALSIADPDAETASGDETPAGVTVDLREVADAVVAELQRLGRLNSVDLVTIFRRWEAFSNGPRWFGQGSLRKLCETLRDLRPSIVIEPGDEMFMHLESAPETPVETSPAAPAAAPEAGLRDRIIAEVKAALAASSRPIDMASLGSRIIAAIGPVAKDSEWAGYKTLGSLVRRALDPNMSVHISSNLGGYVYDPAIHSLAEIPAGGLEVTPLDLPQEILDVVDKVSAVTDCPRLAPSDYHLLFDLIAAYDFGSEFNINAATAKIRDLCVQRGRVIGRRMANFVLAGLRYHDFDFSNPHKSSRDIAIAFRDNLIDLCEHASLQLSEQEKDLIGVWLDIEPTAAAAGSSLPEPVPPENWQESLPFASSTGNGATMPDDGQASGGPAST